MHLHEALARGIANYGVDTVFGVLGDGNVYIMWVPVVLAEKPADMAELR